MSNLRFEAVSEASKRKPVEVTAPSERPSEFFGKKVFNRQKMYKYLPADVYEKLVDVIDNGARLDRNIANAVAKGIKQWADENGVTHYTHWFQPLTEGTAEKHDAFIEHDGKGGMIEEFSGKLLVQQEPDASSFPSGGIRSTFEARGYSAWDPTSPVFIIDDTLCIPTVFISYTGEALDYKAPLLRSLHAVNVAATEVCHYFNPDVKKVISNLGWEQEYFLVDESLYAARPDLMLTGRTLMGHDSAKNQQMDDHYFGAIPERVQAFMKDLEIQALELGIDQSVAHNGVCLTVVEIKDGTYTVTAMKETLDRSNLGLLKVGDKVNVERSMVMNGRLDGHIVQGHVDETAKCIAMKDADGSTYFTFEYELNKEMARKGYFTVDKGSVTVNGVSLTVCDPTDNTFTVAIIPYTRENTNFCDIEVGTVVNIEFDILGKYIARLKSFE